MTRILDSLDRIHSHGHEAWALIRQEANDPDDRRRQRQFSISEAARLLGRGESAIRMAESRGVIPGARRDDRNHRHYTLSEIATIRQKMGIHVGRREGDDLCVVGITSYKGGCGKTTTGVHLAQNLTAKGYRVLLVDMDPQASTTSYFDYIPDYDINGEKDTILPYLVPDPETGQCKTDLSEVIRSTHWGNLDLVPCNLELNAAETTIPMEFARKRTWRWHESFAAALRSVEGDYDVVIVDSPPSLGLISIEITYASTGLLSPMNPGQLDFASTQQYISMVTDALRKFQGKDLSFFRLLLNNMPSKTQRAPQIIANITRAVYGDFVLKNEMGRTSEIGNAAQSLRSIYEIDGPTTSNHRTYKRALAMMDSVCDEIEDVICQTWHSYRDDKGMKRKPSQAPVFSE